VDLALQREELVLQLRPHDGIDGRVRLVHEQHRRIGGQRASHAHPLLLPARQRRGVAVEQPPVEPQQVGQFVHPVGDAATVPAQKLGDRGDVVGHRAVREQSGLLDDVADPAAQLVGRPGADVDSVDPHRAAGGLDEPVDHLEGGGLATPRRSDQRHEFPPRHREIEPGDRRPGRAGVGLRQALEPDGDVLGRRVGGCRSGGHGTAGSV
jgi:hypothetical protein